MLTTLIRTKSCAIVLVPSFVVFFFENCCIIQNETKTRNIFFLINGISYARTIKKKASVRPYHYMYTYVLLLYTSKRNHSEF